VAAGAAKNMREALAMGANRGGVDRVGTIERGSARSLLASGAKQRGRNDPNPHRQPPRRPTPQRL